MKDRISSGFFAGVVGGIGMNTLDWLGYSLGFHQERLLDWASVLTFGRLPANLFEVILAQINQLVYSGVLGIVFAYMLLKLTSGNYLIKGWLFGLIAWFFSYAMSIIVDMPYMDNHTTIAPFIHAASASVYGVVLAQILDWLDRREKV